MVKYCNGVVLTDKSGKEAEVLLTKVGYIGSEAQQATIKKGDPQQI